MAMSTSGRSQHKGGGKSIGPAPFLLKTHQMVEDGETDDVISWGEKGVSFVVWKPVEFARDLLPAHFKHNNFSSFVRQLNTYGFRKVVPDRWEFGNDNFRRGDQRLLSDIHRRKASPQAPPPAVHHPPSSISQQGEAFSSSSNSSPPPKLLHDLAWENEKLRYDNRMLRAELARAKRRFVELLGLLSNNGEIGETISYLGILSQGNAVRGVEEDEDVEEDEGQGEKENCMKLFGVLLKQRRGDALRVKRRRCDVGGVAAVGGSWMGVSSPVGGGKDRNSQV